MNSRNTRFLDSAEEIRFYKWFAERIDYVVCDDLHSIIEDAYGYENLMADNTDIDEVIRNLHCVWGVSGFIDNGGLMGLWTLEMNPDNFVRALRAVGRVRQAEVVSEANRFAVEQIYGGIHPGVFELDPYCIEDMASDFELLKGKVDAWSIRYFDSTQDGEDLFSGGPATFVRENAFSFLELLRLAKEI